MNQEAIERENKFPYGLFLIDYSLSLVYLLCIIFQTQKKGKHLSLLSLEY